MRNNINAGLWMSRIGLGLIFCYCLLASTLYSSFAEIHLTLRFLPFPVFISEIVLLICFLLLAWVSKDRKFFTLRTTLLLGLYFGWVGVKALVNYAYDGPLTFRNAALFYYPIFSVFAYCFYLRAMLPRNVLMSLAFLAAGIMFFKGMVAWYWWTYVMLFIVAVWNTRSLQLRWVGWMFLVVIFLLGPEYFYKGPRAHFVSVFCAIFFLSFYFGALLLKRHKFVRLGILLAVFLLFILGFFVFADRNAVSSLISLERIRVVYEERDRLYRGKESSFVPIAIPVQLYHPNEPVLPSSPVPLASTPKASTPLASASDVFNNILHSKIREGRSLTLDENNILFRLFVWRDMARELIKEKAFWGFSFGRPQRSRSLEVLNWATEEWSRDGWITPHNSFLHIIYRAGILGVCLIAIFFFLIGRLVRDFFIMNSTEGGLLVGALVYWLALSNFFVILELPYNAIVFWTLFGLTWVYRDQLKERSVKQEG